MSARATREEPAASARDAAWPTVQFGDVVEQIKTSVQPEISGLDRYVAGEHMETDDLRIRRWGTIGDGYLGPAFHRAFRAGQVLYGSRRTYLRKVAVPDFAGVCANTTFVCAPADERLAAEFLPFVMQLDAFHAHSISQSKGSVNPYVNWKDLAWFTFRLPSVDAQHRIAALLTEVLAYRDAVEAAAAAAFVAAQAQFAHRWSNAADDNLVRLSDVLARSPESGCSAPERVEVTGQFVLGLQALSAEGYVPDQFKNVDPSDRMTAALLRKGDLLISRSNTIDRVGYVGIFDQDAENVSFPDTMMRLPVDESLAVPAFVARALMSPQGRRHIRTVAAGTSASMKKINRKGLTSFRLPLPSLLAQQETLAALSPVLGLVDRARDAEASTTALVAALREQLLNP